MKFIARLMLIGVVIASTVLPATASTLVTGTLIATESCEAYVSKNKRTNPDDAKLIINQSYSVFEVNKAEDPTWYRIRVTDANPAERWVAKQCGAISIQGGDGGGGGSAPCQTAGQEDSYVLALSWQPAFCETHRDKPECRVEDKTSYQARNFTLHGLWPNKKSCGTNYGYCGEVNGQPGDFCDYPALSLFTETRQNLEEVMPSAQAGSCLQRHEWFKHGTCQTEWSMDEYFDEAIDLTRQFNESGIAYFISRNIGKTVSEATFISKVDCAHGTGAHQRIELKCKGGNLMDVYINLPADLRRDASLGDLLQQGDSRFKSDCGGSFRIDPIGFQ